MPSSSDRKIIFALAFPAVLQTVIRSSFSIVDAYWVGKMGSVQLAGISVATFLVWGVMSIGEMISTGTNSLVAQSEGAENRNASVKISTINITNSFIHSFILGFACIPVLPFLYNLVELNAEQAGFANDYLITFLIGLPCVILLSTVSAVYRGYGDTKTPFYLLTLAVVLNFFLAPLFIFGFELNGVYYLKYGLHGAALSTLAAYLISFIAGYYILRKRGLVKPLKDYIPDSKIIKETYRIGLPISLNGLAFSMIYVFVSRFVSDYGTVGLASLGIGHRSESFAYQVCVGFSLAATILVGQNMGAGKPARAERLAWKVLGYSFILISLYGIALFIFSAEAASVFTSDAAVIEAASNYNKIAAAVLLFSAADVILSGAFSGAGDTVPPAVVGLPINILRIPLCALLSPIYGLTGIWLAIGVSVILKGLILTGWFKKGNWKKRKIQFGADKDRNLLELTNVE